MSDTRRVTDLMEQLPMTPTLYVWRGQKLVGHVWEPIPAPQGGETVTTDTFGMIPLSSTVRRTEDALYLEIPYCYWGDYTNGDVINRSNCRSILRDYEQHVIHVTGPHSFETLVLPMTGEIPVTLFEAILSLYDYPLYDEDDLSTLEAEIEEENWQSWGRRDFVNEVEKVAGDFVEELEDDNYTDRLFDDLKQNGHVEWVTEGCDSGHWSKVEEAARTAWEIIRQRRMT